MKNILKSSKATLAMFVVALALLVTSAIGGTRAALTYFSDDYTAQIVTSDIGVSIVEDGDLVAWRDYAGEGKWNEGSEAILTGLAGEDSAIICGKEYTEDLRVKNTGTIPQYVRATVYRYWLNEEGTAKDLSISPELIDIKFGSSWNVVEKSASGERVILGYASELAKGGKTDPFIEAVTIYPDEKMINTVTETTGTETTTTTTYKYNGRKFVIKVKADAVQDYDHNNAEISAWGIK